MAGPKAIKGKHVLAALLGFFGVIVIANAIFIYLALQSFPGESQKHSYKAGTEYNAVIAMRDRQAELGWRAIVTNVSVSGPDGVIEMTMLDRSDMPLRNLKLSGLLMRPAHAGDDIAIIFNAAGDGVYRANAPSIENGYWDLEVRALSPAGEQFDISARVEFK